MTTSNQPAFEEVIRSRLRQGAELKETMRDDAQLLAEIEKIAAALTGALKAGHKLLLCGNGGSAADAQHIAAELVGRFYSNRDPLPAIAVTANSSTVTAVGNDFSFEDVFARQVRGLGRPGDVLVGLSTSGDSENVFRAIQAAKEVGMNTVAFTGSRGGKLLGISDFCLRVPSEDTARIQEAHIALAHIICELVEMALM